MSFLIDTKNNHINHIANLYSLAGMTESAIGNFGNVHQTVLVDTDINEDTKINDVSYSARQFHSGFQILDIQYILAKQGSRQFITGIAAGFGKFLRNVRECMLTNTAGCRGIFKTVIIQFTRNVAGSVLFAAQQLQKLFLHLI